MSWNDEYNRAAVELDLAWEEYRVAESSLARANARLSTAQREANRLFRERIASINAHT